MKSKVPSKAVILAIDPGYDRCGWAVMSSNPKAEVIFYGCIVTDKKADFFDRLSQVITELGQVIAAHETTELAIETLFFSKNVKTAMRVAETRGAISALCLINAMKIFEYSPVQIKQAVTGNGKADKKSVEKMVRLQLKIPKTEKLLDDTLDALGIGLTHQACRKTYF